MNRVTRLVSGAFVGGAVLSLGFAATPASAAAAGGFCDETQNYICCCTTNADGSIQSCLCELNGSKIQPT